MIWRNDSYWLQYIPWDQYLPVFSFHCRPKFVSFLYIAMSSYFSISETDYQTVPFKYQAAFSLEQHLLLTRYYVVAWICFSTEWNKIFQYPICIISSLISLKEHTWVMVKALTIGTLSLTSLVRLLIFFTFNCFFFSPLSILIWSLSSSWMDIWQVIS